MNAARVAERGLEVVSAVAGRLADFALVFDKVSRQHLDIAHANITFARGNEVEGVLYELGHADEILKMDVFEAAPVNYGRDVVGVTTGEGTIWAWTYFANPAVRASGRLPSVEYLNHLLAGQPFLSATYYAGLAAQPCFGQSLPGPYPNMASGEKNLA